MQRESNMKKGLLFVLVASITLLLFTTAFGQDAAKIGVIDLQRCLKESQEGQKAFQLLKKKKDVLQKELDKKQAELLELRREFEKQGMMLSMDAKEDKKKSIERTARELEYLYKDLREEMSKAQENEKQRIFAELDKVIKKMGSDEDYLLIIEGRVGGVVYFADSVDITDRVIRAYDQMKEENKE